MNNILYQDYKSCRISVESAYWSIGQACFFCNPEHKHLYSELITILNKLSNLVTICINIEEANRIDVSKYKIT